MFSSQVISPFTAVLITVLLALAGLAMAADDDCSGNNKTEPATTTPQPCFVVMGPIPIMCYECSSIDTEHFCNDPFNDTHPDVKLVRCKDFCVKWTRTTLSGKMLVQRTCSEKLQIGIRKSEVCIQESRPSEGMLCFCEHDKCNSATQMHSSCQTFGMFILAVIVLVIQQQIINIQQQR